MNEEHAQYYSNYKTVNRLLRPKFPSDMTKDAILTSIHAGAEQVAELKAWNDRFLNETIYQRRPESISSKEKTELSELADVLFQNGRGVDTGVAYRIHNLLDSYAIAHGDLNLHIRELYYQGLVLNYFHLYRTELNINLQGDKIHHYFSEGASYLKDYETIPSEETRAFILRCLGNRKYGCPAIKGTNDWQHPHDMAEGYPVYMKIFNEAMAVFQSEKYQKMNPDLPWNTYQYAMHFDRTIYLQSARDDRLREEMPELYNDIVKGVLESAEYVYRHQEQIAKLKHQTVGARTRYVYAAAQYHAGRISVSELLDIILGSIADADEGDYSANGIASNLNLSVYAKAYFDVSPKEVQQAIQPRIQEILDRSYRYLINYPSDDSINPKLAKVTAELTRERISQDKEFRNHMMNYLLVCHAPTCVHSQMVAILTKAMMGRLIQVNPSTLVGILDTMSTEEVIRRREEIVQRAYHCGLYHDIGKSDVLNYITIYGRRLLDEEFEAIQYHPVMGYYILNDFEDLWEESEVALRHHLFYNEKGGYPRRCPPCPPSIKMLVNIVAVADSMDAATDDIGRSYAVSKQFSTLIQELRDGSGVRYCPEVVALFDNSGFSDELERILIQNRREIYYTVYRSIDGKDADRLILSDSMSGRHVK